VLRRLGRRLRVEAGVEVGRAAAGLEGCTGADLQALAHDAQLKAVHRLLDSPPPAGPGGGPGGGAVVSWGDLERAAAELRPSLSGAERAKYEAINRAFSQARRPPRAHAASHAAPVPPRPPAAVAQHHTHTHHIRAHRHRRPSSPARNPA
jgi:hypothetical protein